MLRRARNAAIVGGAGLVGGFVVYFLVFEIWAWFWIPDPIEPGDGVLYALPALVISAGSLAVALVGALAMGVYAALQLRRDN